MEFALVAMLLLTLVFGIAEFGRMWLLQSSLSAAARDTARELAIHKDEADLEAQADKFILDDTPDIAVVDCDSGPDAEVTLTYDAEFMTFIGDSVTLEGKGVMRCGG